MPIDQEVDSKSLANSRVKMERSIWPNVSSEDGRAFAFRLAAAGAFLLAAATAVAFVAVLAGFQSALGYPSELPAFRLLVSLAITMISSLILGFALRGCSPAAAWLFAILVFGCFLVDAWWGSGAALWLVIVLAISSLQGLRAVFGKGDGRPAGE